MTSRLTGTQSFAGSAPLGIEKLTSIWEQVLRSSPIGVEENFFVLGGDRPAADLLFDGIATAFGRRLPSATIDRAPTIASLAAVLNQPERSTYTPRILMRPGGSSSAVFIVHGLSGSIGELSQLVSHIDTSRAIYGIQAQGIDGLNEPLECVEDMAKLYLASIDEVEPRGPYLLIGYSFGGLVAIEMARRLSAIGKEVALLTMVDTNLHPSYLPKAQRLRLSLKRLQYHRDQMRALSFPDSLRYLSGKTKVRLGFTPDPKVARRKALAAHPLSFAYTASRLIERGFAARAAYRPSFYGGTVRYVLAETESFFLPHNPRAVWGHLVEKLEIEAAPGDHEGLIRGGAQALGAILTRHIRGASDSI